MSLGDGSAWNEALPDNSTIANQIDDYNRDLRVGVRARMSLEHIWPTSQTATGQAGYHSFLTFQAQTAAPTLVAASGQVAGLYVQTNGLFFENSAGASIQVISATNKIDGANIVGRAGLPVGSVVQVVNTQTGTVSTGTTAIPADNTIPVNTEGDQYMTLAITPTSATNNLMIDVTVYGTTDDNTDSDTLIAALFQDTTANALAVGTQTRGTTQAALLGGIHLRHFMAAGTTSSTTFKVRAGGALGNTFTFNGVSGAGLFNGKLVSSITITEIQA